MVFFVFLSFIDLLCAVLGLFFLGSGVFVSWLFYLLVIVFFKGVWSVLSYPLGLIGWLDVVVPVVFFFYLFFPFLSVFSYVVFCFLFFKGLFCLFSNLF